MQPEAFWRNVEDRFWHHRTKLSAISAPRLKVGNDLIIQA